MIPYDTRKRSLNLIGPYGSCHVILFIRIIIKIIIIIFILTIIITFVTSCAACSGHPIICSSKYGDRSDYCCVYI